MFDSAIYDKKIINNQTSDFHYFILWKGYPKEKNTLETLIVIMHLGKLIHTFHKKHPKS